MTELPKYMPLRLLVNITNADKRKIVEEIMLRAHVGLRFQFKAKGTASSEILDILGVGETEKIVTIGVAPCSVIRRVFEVIRIELQLSKAGRGIAFTLPLSGISSPVYKMLDPQVRQTIQDCMESEVKKMKVESSYDLILAAINLGYSEELMDAAREAGARGGTVIHARHLDDADRLKFWGIAVQEEREIVAILAKKEHKREIMKAINHHCGIATEAHGIVFSMPVDEVAGLDAALPEDAR